MPVQLSGAYTVVVVTMSKVKGQEWVGDPSLMSARCSTFKLNTSDRYI